MNINLALIKNENEEQMNLPRLGSIDKIAKKKEPIKLNYLFKDANDWSKVCSPGTGK